MKSKNSFNTQSNIVINGKNYLYFNLNTLSDTLSFDLIKLPISIKILIENLIRNEDGESVTKDMIKNICSNLDKKEKGLELAF